MHFSPNISTTQSIEKGWQGICKDEPFVVMPLHIESTRAELISTIPVDQIEGGNYAGSLNGLEEWINRGYEGIVGRAARQVLAEQTLELSYAVLSAANCSHGWFSLQTFDSTLNYETRWHSDGTFFDSADVGEGAIQAKFAWCPLGASTLFAAMAPERRRQYEEAEYEMMMAGADFQGGYSDPAFNAFIKPYQDKLNSLVEEDPSCIVHPRTLQDAAFFRVGAPYISGVHNRPVSRDPRCFYSIVPGSEKQITELSTRWS